MKMIIQVPVKPVRRIKLSKETLAFVRTYGK